MPGVLKGRPIHAATDTPATGLSKYLANSLNVLLKHVPSHLKNTEEFVKFLSDFEGEIYGFCSLDVCNLYGSIPLEDANINTPGVFTVAKRFFLKHKSDCDLLALCGEDFESLLRLCLTSDVVLIGGKGYNQKTGLAMGNNLAPTLAMIYMNEIDSQILDIYDGSIFLKRYIDDIFLIWTSNTITQEDLLSAVNNLNAAIKFTIEMPNDNQIPFLDTMVSFDCEMKTFSTTLYVKSIHSQCITPWDSHGSISSKRAILIGETRRAISRSTDSASRTKSLRIITSMFTRNGYPREFVKTVIKRTLRTSPRKEDHERDICLKLPFINEELKRRALAVLHRSGMKGIRVHFMNGQPSSKVFAPSREKQNCPADCETCTLALKVNRCFTKHCIYRITCSHCHTVYIGETGRTIGSRVKEHLRMKKQTVYTHLKSHNINPLEGSPITWEILHSNIKYFNERRIIEALETRKHSNNIMNGCIGRSLCI